MVLFAKVVLSTLALLPFFCFYRKTFRTTLAKPDSLRKSAAEIRSGISDGHEVESWVPALELIEQACYQKFFTERWGVVMRLFARFPRFSCKFSSLLGYRIK